jgi:hypothetical protein
MSEYVTIEEFNSLKKDVERIDGRMGLLEQDSRDMRDWQKENGVLIKNINKSVETLISDVKELASKPEKRWDLVVTAAIAAVVTAFITAIVSGIMPGIK